MSSRARIAAYAAGLLVLFAAAFVLGGALAGGGEEHGGGDAEHAAEQPGTTSPRVEEDAGHGEIGGSHGEAARGPGAGDAHDLKLELVSPHLTAGDDGELRFRVLDAAGEPLTRFQVEHTKQVHLIVVSRDLQSFQHVHPRPDGDEWSARVRPQQPGDHRVIADVKHDGRKLALAADVTVAGEPRAVGQPAGEARFQERPITAGQPVTLRFEAPGETEPYLGAAGHLVVLSEGDLEYLHVHPHEDRLAFEATFPQPGRYVLFLEYQRAGEVRVSRFEATVGAT